MSEAHSNKDKVLPSNGEQGDPKLQASLASYDVAALMAQTRKLAADYRKQTGQALPVTEELARFDAISLLNLIKCDDLEGVDALSLEKDHAKDSPKYLIKGRVIFKAGKARQKLGKLSLHGQWNTLLMVIYDGEYSPSQIYSIERAVIESELANLASDKRGSMTVAKYKAIGQLVWQNEEDSEAKTIPEKRSQNKSSTLSLSSKKSS